MDSSQKNTQPEKHPRVRISDGIRALHPFVKGALLGAMLIVLVGSTSALSLRHGGGADKESVDQGFDSAVATGFRSGSVPERLHFDASDKVISKLTFGDVPLSYTELFVHPDSDYTRMIRGLSQLVTDSGDRFVANFRPAEVVGADIDMLMGAVCITEQNMDALYPYHAAVLASAAPLSTEEIRRAATADSRIDAARFDACFHDEDWRKKVVADMNPESLSVAQAVDKEWADGKPFPDALSLCNDGEGVAHVADIVPCAKELLAEAELHGSLLRYADERLNVALSASNEAPLQLPQVIRFGYDRKHRQYRITATDANGVETLVATPGKGLGEHAALWIDGPRLNVVNALTGSGTSIWLTDGNTYPAGPPPGVALLPDERMWFIRAIDGGYGTLLCKGSESPYECRFVYSAVHEGNTYEAKFPIALHLYEGLRLTGWDSRTKIATFSTNGGDGPWRASSELTLDLVTGEKKVLYSFNGDLVCLGAHVGQNGCDQDVIDAANGWKEWVEAQQPLLSSIAGCPWLADAEHGPGADYVGCAQEIIEGHVDEE